MGADARRPATLVASSRVLGARWLRRPLIAGLLLLAVYVVLSLPWTTRRLPRHRHRRQGRDGQGHVGARRLRSRRRVLGEPVGPRRSGARPRTTRRRSATGTSTSRRCRWCWRPGRCTTSVATAPPCCCRWRVRSRRRSPPVRSSRRLRPATTAGSRSGSSGLASPLGDLRPRPLGAHASASALHGVGRGRALRRRVRPTDLVARPARRGSGSEPPPRCAPRPSSTCLTTTALACASARLLDGGERSSARCSPARPRSSASVLAFGANLAARGRRARPTAAGGASVGRGIAPGCPRSTCGMKEGLVTFLSPVPDARRAGFAGRGAAC